MQNIEQYTLNYIDKYWKMYCKWLEDNDGKDIDYPNFKFNFK